MDNTSNPLIHDAPSDTLHHVHCILLLLEELYASTDSQWLQDESKSVGSYALLRCANHAIAFELERMTP